MTTRVPRPSEVSLPHPRPRRWAHWVGRNWARLTYGRHIEPRWLELNVHPIPVVHLPSALDGFRIAHLSDLHAGSSVPLAYLDEAVDLANAQCPDLIAVTGDFIHKGYRYVDRVAALVSRLSAPQGVYAVLGNHDYSVRNALGLRTYRRLHHAVERSLQGNGITVLRNRAQTLTVGGQQLNVIGVDDLWSGDCDVSSAFKTLPPAAHRLLLAHNPRTIEHLQGRHCDLILSGHTHGGQINWPGMGRFLLSQNARRFAAGLYHYQNCYMYVNRGVGHGVRFRFGARPEVAVMTLHPANAPALNGQAHV